MDVFLECKSRINATGSPDRRGELVAKLARFESLWRPFGSMQRNKPTFFRIMAEAC